MLSGDYRGATNYLHPEVAEAILEIICNEFDVPWNIRSILFGLLTRHHIDTPGMDGDEYTRQLWGQLMGSPISFVILCIANACANHLFQELALKRKIPIPKRDDPPNQMVNGDDLMMPILDGLHADDLANVDRWPDWVSRLGLIPSVGKNFVSATHCTVNSQLIGLPMHWELCEEKWEGTVELLPVLRVAMCFPPLKDLVRTPLRTQYEKDIADRFEYLIKGQEGREELLVSTALKQCGAFLKRYPAVISWFMPKALGGIGLPWTREGTIRKSHLRMAGYMKCLHPKDRDDQLAIHTSLLPAATMDESVAVLEDRQLEDQGAVWAHREFSPGGDEKLITDVSRWDVLTDWEAVDSIADERAIKSRLRLWGQRVSKAIHLAMKTALKPMSESKVSTMRLFPWVRTLRV
jgi:hypothetical protein